MECYGVRNPKKIRKYQKNRFQKVRPDKDGSEEGHDFFFVKSLILKVLTK